MHNSLGKSDSVSSYCSLLWKCNGSIFNSCETQHYEQNRWYCYGSLESLHNKSYTISHVSLYI